MKNQISHLLVLFLVFCVNTSVFAADTEEKQSVDGNELKGIWKVDLRPTPDAEAYYQYFVVDSIDGKSFTGSFYGTKIENGRINFDWGKIYFAFVTRDGSGEYHHSGYLEKGVINGLTHSIGRAFLSVWTAEHDK